MSRIASLFFVIALFSSIFAQGQSTSDPQALSLAAQSLTAMTGGISISDVTLTGTASWNVGSTDTGTATLMALGTGESRMDLALTSGTRTEIRDSQTGVPLGKWVNPGNASGQYSSHNCWTDSVWFFPPLGSLATGQNVVLSYIGQESRNGASVQHIHSSINGQPSNATIQQLSSMEFYLDSTTLLPVAITFNSHPDNDAATNFQIEVDFFTYQSISGVLVPTHIQRYSDGNLILDAMISNAAVNTGLPLFNFAVN